MNSRHGDYTLKWLDVDLNSWLNVVVWVELKVSLMGIETEEQR